MLALTAACTTVTPQCYPQSVIECPCPDGHLSHISCEDGKFTTCFCPDPDVTVADAGGDAQGDGGASDSGSSDSAATDVVDVADSGSDANGLTDASDVADADAADTAPDVPDVADVPDVIADVDAGKPDTGPDVQISDISDTAGDADVSKDAGADSSSDTSSDAGQDVWTPVVVPPNPCSVDADCKAVGGVCDPWNLVCVQCVIDTQCPTNQHCWDYQCKPYTPCTYISDCKTAVGPSGQAQAKCDHYIGECSACLVAADCPANNDCVRNECKPFKACVKSTQCAADEICDTTTKHCLQCLVDDDCGAGKACVAQKCVAAPLACTTDKDCKATGQVCDKVKGKCSDCLSDAQCPDSYFCSPTGQGGVGRCVVDECVPGWWRVAGSWKCKSAIGSWAPEDTCAPGGYWLPAPTVPALEWTEGKCMAGAGAVVGGGLYGKGMCTDSPPASWSACPYGLIPGVGPDGQPIFLNKTCEPGGVFCAGNNAAICDSEGLHALTATPCLIGQTCSNGVCAP